MIKKCVSLCGCYTFSVVNGMNVIKHKYSTWRPCIIVAYRKKNKCFQIFSCFTCLCTRPSVLSISNWLLFLIQYPTLVLPNTTVTPTEPQSFLHRVGQKKLMDAETRCYRRMRALPPYRGEGKERAVCQHGFQISLRAHFLPWVNLYWLISM